MITLMIFFGGIFVGMGIMSMLTVSAMESRAEEERDLKEMFKKGENKSW